MKKLFILALTAAASASPALAAQPDIVCREQSGFRYEFYFSRFNEIHVFDENGRAIDHIDGIQMKYLTIETHPTIDQYTFQYAEEGNKLAVIEFTGNSKSGHGEMIDNDQKMSCRRR